MIDKLVDHIVKFKKIWGIHIEESSEGDYRIDGLLLEYRRGVVYILEKRQIAELSDLSALASTQFPVSISYSGYQVLYKAAESGRNIENILPGLNHEEFYSQYLDSVGTRFFFVVRKEHFGPFMQQLSDYGLNIVSVTLGPVNVSCLSPFIEKEESRTVVAGRFSIQFSKGEIVNLQRENDVRPESIKIGEDNLGINELIPYANSLYVFSKDRQQVADSIQNDWNYLLLEEKHRAFFKKVLPILMGAIFTILLLSFVILQVQTQKNDDLSFTLGNYQEQLTQLEKLKRSLDDKQLIQSNIRLNNALFLSFYADRIAESVGNKVRLTSLIINPELESNTSRRQDLQFDQGEILVSGTCDSPLDLNDWLANLRKLEFVDNVEDQSYRFDPREGKGVFELSLKVLTP